MSEAFFDTLSVFSIFIGTVLFIFVSFEVGYQVAKYIRSKDEKKTDTTQGPMVGGVLAMLAFVLAFTFSMTASRFDERKQNILLEVNEINTAYLRADLLAEPHKSEMKQLLREYVAVRLNAVEDKQIEIVISKSLEIHKRLWSLVTGAVKQNSTSLNPLLVQSVNNIINLHENRVNAAIRNRIPDSIWLTLILITAFSMVTIGSQTGLIKTRRLIQVIPAVFAFSALITLIVDLDRPAQLGQIQINHEAMIDLQLRMNQTP